jgi:hypothetical protein
VANQFLNAQEYANVMLLLLKNQLVTGKLVDGQFKDQVTDQNGLSISVKRPPRFIAKSGATLQAQDMVVGSVNVAVNQYKNVHISVGDLEYVQSFNSLMRNESMKSAASTLAHDVDRFLQNKVLGFHSWVAGNATTGGVNASDPSKNVASSAQAMAAHTRLMSQGVPNSDISSTLSFTDAELIRGALLSSFTPAQNATALQKVKIPLISEMDWYATQNIPTLTTGTRPNDATAQVNGANQNVNYRTVKDTMTQTFNADTFGNAKTIKAGEVFTIAGVYAWDWRANQALDYLQQFTVTTDATTDVSAGTVALTISPPIIVQGTNDGTSTDTNTAFATVDSIPADDAKLTFVGTLSTGYKVKAAWHKRAIALVSARLQMPFTGVASFATDPDTGISIRYWRGSDISTGAHVHRWDMIYGAAVMDPFLGTRICGS